MERFEKRIPISQLSPDFIKKLQQWASQFDTFAWLDSNDYPQQYTTFEKALAVEAFSEIKCNIQDAFEQLKEYKNGTNNYIFGYLTYDLKNEIEDLTSNNFDGLQFPYLYFFEPKKLFFIYDTYIEIIYHRRCADAIEKDLQNIKNQNITLKAVRQNLEINTRISKENYLQKFEQLQLKIVRGDTYETNLCMEFYVENIEINPLDIFTRLNEKTKAPFSVFFRHQQHYLLSVSPERFIRKEGNKIITQPIKGTAKRFNDTEQDLRSKHNLENDQKERSENIMIVDLVRNDLSKTASKGSVKVEELSKVYALPNVYQMISTVTSIVKPEVDSVDVIRNLFPMGSMTGAPKIASMKMIEALEETKRGLYSGAFGYFSPTDDFDFNVIIRSILYNSDNKYLSFSVGGAITFPSKGENEYQECLLKAESIFETLKNK
jgi:para-aminobenzoate synthetase component 1